jgi:hypothetical protein
MNGGSKIEYANTTFSESASYGSTTGLIRWKMPLFSEECSTPFESS